MSNRTRSPKPAPSTSGRHAPDRPDGADKVTGRARFGADFNLPGMLIGKVLRSPHAHARIGSIDTSKAEALPGVKAVMTSKDFPDQANLIVPTGEMQVNLRDITRNIMAREKVLYEGHRRRRRRRDHRGDRQGRRSTLIEVDYEVLPHVIDVDEAMKPDAPVLHDDMITEGVDPPADQAVEHRQAHRVQEGRHRGGLRRGRGGDREGLHHRRPCTRAISSRTPRWRAPARTARSRSGRRRQGHFQVRGFCAKLLNIDTSQIRVTPTEIGGGFGGKTVVYLEPLAITLSQKSGQPVKMMMTREEVFRASGPAPGGNVKVKIGAKKDGSIVAAECTVEMQAGAFPGSPVGPACMCAFACYDIDNVAHRRLRRRQQPAEGRGLSRARRADLGVRGRVRRSTCWRCKLKHGPDRPAPEERRQEGHQDRLRRHLQHDRPGRDAGSRQELRALPDAARSRAMRAASPRASGSTSAPIRAPRATSTRTARSR